MRRVALGWIGGAGRQPAARSAPATAPPVVLRAAALDLRVDPEVGDAAGPLPGAWSAGLGEGGEANLDAVGGPRGRDRSARRVGERPRQGRGRRSRTWAPDAPVGAAATAHRTAPSR